MSKHPKRLIILSALVMVMALATPAMANMPMFYVIAFTKMARWPWLTIPLTLLIEAIAVRWIFQLNWKRAAIASVGVNLASGLLGFVLYPIVGMVLYHILAPTVIELTGGGVTSPEV